MKTALQCRIGQAPIQLVASSQGIIFWVAESVPGFAPGIGQAVQRVAIRPRLGDHQHRIAKPLDLP